MPGPAKDSLRNNATVILTKDEGKAVRTSLKHVSAALPQDLAEIRTYLANLTKELQLVKSMVEQQRARIDKLEVGGAGTAVTF